MIAERQQARSRSYSLPVNIGQHRQRGVSGAKSNTSFVDWPKTIVPATKIAEAIVPTIEGAETIVPTTEGAENIVLTTNKTDTNVPLTD